MTDSRFNWITSYPRFRWVLFWNALFVISLVASNMVRTGGTAATQLNDRTDTNRIWFTTDFLGYLSGGLLAIAAFITIKWLVHFCISFSRCNES